MTNRYNYPHPEKDGHITIYPDGWCTVGSWSHRLNEWRQRCKTFENLIYLAYTGDYDDKECVGVYTDYSLIPENPYIKVEEMFINDTKPKNLFAYNVTLDKEGDVQGNICKSIWQDKIHLNSDGTSYRLDNTFYNDPKTYLCGTLWAESEDEALQITQNLREILIEQGKFK